MSRTVGIVRNNAFTQFFGSLFSEQTYKLFPRDWLTIQFSSPIRNKKPIDDGVKEARAITDSSDSDQSWIRKSFVTLF
jgi:hypothetical protein